MHSVKEERTVAGTRGAGRVSKEEKACMLAAKTHFCTRGMLHDHSMTEEPTWSPTVPCNEASKSSTVNDGVGDNITPAGSATRVLSVLLLDA